MVNLEKERLEEALIVLRQKLGGFVPKIGITLGSGLDFLTGLLVNQKSCNYSDIPGCPVPGATGHNGRLWWGMLTDVPVLMMEGRVHLYEGYSANDAVFLTRLAIMAGAKQIILTHAVGAVTKNLEPGDIVGIRSHIALNCPDPTAGLDAKELGQEFTPMGDAYSPRLLALAKQCALSKRVSFHFGVSHFKTGRTYESEAEVEAMRRAGADVGTMSTILEVMAAIQMGAEVLDLALVTNMGSGLGSVIPISHDDVRRVAKDMAKPFGGLIHTIVWEMRNM